ncbi:hypothetical protein [Burkholderia sp. LS-044]|uniref:hypothetical protein n=1 Tax=Burkholderia sp. LS-044 TaxID=1459967 RepID=UPI001FFFA91E|nr:hypothetical protein [Burkholderia sp. LS-044]
MADKLVGLRADLHTWAGIAVTCTVLGAVCLSGYVCHVWIEQPMLTVLSRRFRRARGTVEPSA